MDTSDTHDDAPASPGSENATSDTSLATKMPQIDIGKLIHDAIEAKLQERGRVNVLIAGKTGVGKSTLINAVFQGNLATTGQGRPITTETREIKKEGVPLHILDTQGLELGKERFAETMGELKRVVQERGRNPDPSEHVHVAWICIAEDSRRVEESESELAKMLDDAGVPVIAVVTKTRRDDGFRSEVQKLIPVARNVVSVRAIRETFDGTDIVLKPEGLGTLVEITMEVVPEGQKNAFAAAQRVSVELKSKRAHGAVAVAALTATGIGASPIPFSDAALLVPAQVGMLAGISAIYGLDLGKGFLATLVSSALGAGAGTFAGRTLVANLVKMVPGAGTVAGGIISGGTAAAMTTAIGEAYIAALSALLKDNPDRELTAEEVTEEFLSKLKGSHA